MRFVKFKHNDKIGQGVLDNQNEIHLIGPMQTCSALEARFTIGGNEEIKKHYQSDHRLSLEDVELLVPFDPFRKIICAGVNYRDHAGEISAEEPKNPILFTRSLDTLVPANQAVLRPKVSETFDFEGEIAIMIGQGGRHIKPEQAMAHVFGYCCFMDGSVRAYQRHSLTQGKNFWQSGSMGPWIVSADEIGDADLAVTTRLNDQIVQQGKASQMIFGIAALISYCSQWTLLQPGDVIATGTPGGVGSRRTPPLWMKEGDKISVEIEKVGILQNHVKNEA